MLQRLKRKLKGNIIIVEGEEMAEDEDSPTVEGELPLTAKKAAVPELQGQ